jgi:hypothetical protein
VVVRRGTLRHRHPGRKQLRGSSRQHGRLGHRLRGSLDITNTGSEPISGWTLAFALPRSWETFAIGWNATWVADGASVSATNLDWNAVIGPGATVNIGYVADYTGPNVLPRVFSLNGTTCTSK